MVVRPGQPDRHRRGLRFRVASAAAGGRIEVRTGAVDGPLLGTATVPATGGWQTYTDVTATLAAAAPTTGPLFFVAREPGSATPAALFNVNWVDFLGRGVTDNAPPVVTAVGDPDRPAPRRSRSPSPARPPTPRATCR